MPPAFVVRPFAVCAAEISYYAITGHARVPPFSRECVRPPRRQPQTGVLCAGLSHALKLESSPPTKPPPPTAPFTAPLHQSVLPHSCSPHRRAPSSLNPRFSPRRRWASAPPRAAVRPPSWSSCRRCSQRMAPGPPPSQSTITTSRCAMMLCISIAVDGRGALRAALSCPSCAVQMLRAVLPLLDHARLTLFPPPAHL